MSEIWPEVKLIAADNQVESLETWLFEAGALSVTLLDPTSSDDPLVAVLEPVPNEVRLWKRVAITGLFAQGSNSEALHAALELAADSLGLVLPEYHIDALADTDWERTWLEHFRPMSFGEHLWVIPGDQAAVRDDAVNLRLDPGLAFGTGTHPTTALCLEWLGSLVDAGGLAREGDQRSAGALAEVQVCPEQALKGCRVLDYGTGSGVLAIAALLLGAEQVVAVDIDPQALQATRQNAAANGVENRLTVLSVAADASGTELAGQQFDLVLANILYRPLMGLASTFADHLPAGGSLVMAGILRTQVEPLAILYNQWFDFLPLRERDDWALLCARRREN